MEPITLTRRRFFQALAASVVAAAAPLPVGMPHDWTAVSVPVTYDDPEFAEIVRKALVNNQSGVLKALNANNLYSDWLT